MALDAGFGPALRTEAELKDLIGAIVKADPEDELDWIEWKRTLDLGDRATHGTLARHVLGMANRRPEQAMLRAGGCGYVVVGAEPANPCGVSPVDPADLTKGIRPYLGSEGPVWSAAYVAHSGVSVLLITVEPPVRGARIFTLQKALRVTDSDGKIKEYLAGTVFVRHTGETIQATPSDIRTLEERYAAPFRQQDAHDRIDRRRRRLTAIADLIAEVQHKAYQVNNPHPWRCPEQIKLPSLLIGLELSLPECRALAGASQGHEAYGAAILARQEVERELRRLAQQEAAIAGDQYSL
jgi:hypothetical protein